MNNIAFATGNAQKITIAQTVSADFGISVQPISLDIDEIQGEDPRKIVAHKAREAFKQIQKPVVVSDDSWSIPALNGFAGPYMKSVNHWFSAADFLRLMHGVSDRSIFLHQYLAYIDEAGMHVVTNDLHGVFTTEPRGDNSASANMNIVALDSDNGKTIAEVFEQGESAVAERYKNRPDAWHEMAAWLSTR